MSMTLRKHYANVAVGQLKASMDFLADLNGGFDFPNNIPKGGMGTATVELWDTFGTFAPTPGTIQTAQQNNLLVDLTVGNRGTNMVKNGKEKHAMEYNAEAMKSAAVQAGDALGKYLQGLVVAAGIAATPGLSIAMGTGYIDAIVPSAATNPDVINNVVAPISRTHARARLNFGKVGLVGVCSETFYARAQALIGTLYCPPQLTLDGSSGVLRWLGDPIHPVTSETSFGGASNTTLFWMNKRAFALNFQGPYQPAPTADGWFYRSDNMWAWDWEIDYAYGVGNAEGISEVTNPAS